MPQDCAFVGLSGPSGAGKSTLMRCLAGLSERATVAGGWQQTIIGEGRTGLVFQDSLLFSHLSVKGNLDLAMEYAAKTRFTLDDVTRGCHCQHLLARMPHTLSGGEAQRVAIARAILNSPDMLLLDEPVSALDNSLKHEVLKYLSALAEKGMKIVMVSHDLHDIALYCDAMAWLENGCISSQGEVEQVLATLADTVASYEGQFSVLKGEVVNHLPAQNCYQIRVGEQVVYARKPVIQKNRATLTVDARDVSLDREHALASSIVNSLPCHIEAIHCSEDKKAMVTLRCNDVQLFAVISTLSLERLGFEVGEPVTARFKLR
nr:ATP-binding cassette domain-containing protein [Alteromonas sp. C1M14]